MWIIRNSSFPVTRLLHFHDGKQYSSTMKFRDGRRNVVKCFVTIWICCCYFFKDVTTVPVVNCLERTNEIPDFCDLQPITNCVFNSTTLHCCRISNLDAVMYYLSSEEVLHVTISQSELTNLNVTQFRSYTLQSVTVTRSRVQALVGTFSAWNNIIKLNLSQNCLKNISGAIIESLPGLQLLDLSNNNISRLPTEITSITNLTVIDLLGNQIDCNQTIKLYDWYRETGNKTIQNQDKIFCSSGQGDQWYNHSITFSLRDAFLAKKEMEEGCVEAWAKNCTCFSYTLHKDGDRTLAPFQVNCSGRGLYQVPSVPEHTWLLDITNNNIPSLEFLLDERFRNLIILIADDNYIDSLLLLVQSQISFSFISLKRNRLKSIPMDKVRGMLERNKGLGAILLSGNCFICNCKTAREDKPWLLQNTEIFKDYYDIKCDPSFNQEKLKDLDENLSCLIEEGPDWSPFYINIAIAVEAILCVTLIARLSYDAWRFHKTGYLPWISAKMPPLPCDCMLETLSQFSKGSS